MICGWQVFSCQKVEHVSVRTVEFRTTEIFDMKIRTEVEGADGEAGREGN